MTRQRDLTTAMTVIRRRGRAEQPTVAQVVAEIRSDSTIPIQSAPHPQHALGPLVIEWTYCVPWAKMSQFNQWLVQNESYIANFCNTTMQGVTYLGTYVAMDGNDVHYKTIWSYDSIADVDKWTTALRARTQKFYRTIRTLRSYWAHDYCPKEYRYQPAALFADLDNIAKGDAFLAMTLDAAAQP